MHACSFFYVRLAGFTLYSIFFFFTFRGTFHESVDGSLVDARYCSALLQSPRTRAHIHFRSSPHFRRPSLVLFFSNEQFLFHLISSHLTSNFHYQSINCLVPQNHPTISVLLLTPSVKSPLLLSRMFFFRVIIALFVRPVARASLELSGNNRFSPSGRLAPRLCTILPSSHPHTFPRNFHTYKHIHTQYSLAHSFSPTRPGFTINSKCQTKRKIRSHTAAACA